MAEVNTRIGNVDKVCNILVVLDHYFQMTSEDIIRTLSR